MQWFRVWWSSFKTVALLISFLFNMVLVFVLLIVLMQIFRIKNGILEPLIDGLHANFVGLDEAVIVRTIDVNDQIPVEFDLPLNQSTNVVLTDDVPIAANATFTLPGGGGVINGRVDIVLPRGSILPVQLNMTVPVDTQIPIHLPVAVSIPLKETELHEPFDNLRRLLEPYVRVIDNLPSDWDEAPDFLIDAVQGDGVYLVAPTDDSENAWEVYQMREAERESPDLAQDTAPPEGAEPLGPRSDELQPVPTATPVQNIGATPVQDIGIVTPP